MDEEEKSDRPVMSAADLVLILTAAFFGLMFLAGFVWLFATNDPWGDFIPKSQATASPPVEHHQKETPGVVPVTLPPKN